MKNRADYTLWVIVLVVFVVLGLWFIKLNKTPNDNSIKNNVNIYANKTLKSTINNMLKHNEEQLSIIRKSCINDDKLFFIYSKKACSTCIDHALTDLYVLAKNIKSSKEIIVLTHELDKRYIKQISERYDNLLNFVSMDEKVWDTYSSKLNGITSLFFVTNSELNITDSYVFNYHKDENNQLYYNFIKEKYYCK